MHFCLLFKASVWIFTFECIFLCVFTQYITIWQIWTCLFHERRALTLAEALVWHSTHSLALLNCHSLPWGEDYSIQRQAGKKGIWQKPSYWPCLFPPVDACWWFIIHGCLCVWSQASYCHLNQISISTTCNSAAALPLTPKLWPLSLPALQTSPCVFSDYARYLFSQMRPADQMAIGLSCPSYSNPLP